MGGRAYSVNNMPTYTTTYSGIQVQTTSGALPIPIVYGRNMLTPNCVWYNNFQRHKSGGKGGKGGGSSNQSYTYSCSIALALCEGPIAAIGMVLDGAPPAIPFSWLQLTLHTGTTPQTVDAWLESAYPTQALSYQGTAVMVGEYFNLGASATIGSYSLEVCGVLTGSGVNGLDADPAQVIYDFLTNSQYGVGFPASAINATALFANSGDSSYQTYCWAAYLAISPLMINQESAASALTRWLQITNSTAVWSSGQLKIIPYGDTVISVSGKTYTPNTTALYALTDEDLLNTEGEDPVKITRADPFTLPNWRSIEILSRADYYAPGPVTVWDQNAIQEFVLRVGPTVSAHEICDTTVGQASIQLILQRELYIRNTYQFKLSAEFCLLDPMDIVTLTDPLIGLNNTAVRITEVEEDENGDFAFTAEEFQAGVATGVQYPIQAVSNGFPVNTVTPNSVNAPMIVEPPPGLTNDVEQIWIAVSPVSGDPNWGGCVVYASLDGVSYAEVETITLSAQQGTLSATLPAYGGANPDATDTLAVTLAESLGSLSATTTAAAAAAAITLCYVNGEWLSFTTATLTAANAYNLTGLYRGLYGSTLGAKASGASFCLIDGSTLKYDIPTAEIGATIWFKFQSFNIFGAGAQSLSTCTAYAYTVTGAGSLGPVASGLAVGTAMDYGNVESTISETDDWGVVSGQVIAMIDLGNCTS